MAMRVIDCEQGSPEWKAARCGKVSASRLDAVMAKGKGSAPSATRTGYMGELIAEVLTGVKHEGYSNADMDRGVEMEPAALKAYEFAMGDFPVKVGFVLHPTIDDAGASPDGLVGERGLVQIKCPRTHTHIEYLTRGEVPAEYVKQMCWECVCTEREWCDFVSFDPRMPKELQLFVVRYTPTAALMAEQEQAVREFLAERDAKVAELRALALKLAA